jgi:gliding motility-associated-like protein
LSVKFFPYTLRRIIIVIIILFYHCEISFPQVNGFPDKATIANDSKDMIMFQVCYNGKPSFCSSRLLNLFVPPFLDSYHPPVVSTFVKKIFQNQTLEFTQRDFTTSYVDVDDNVLSAIKLESLPFHGKVRLYGVDVYIGQVIQLDDLRNLEFIPDKDYLGTTSFRWVASDGKEYSVSSASVSISVIPRKIFIPEGFSPNGDGTNDLFVINGADKYSVSFKVYNRWGYIVFESDNYLNNWDGTANVGSLKSCQLPEGTYFFIVNLNNGTKDLIGYLTLIR